MTSWTNIWESKTARFTVACDVAPEDFSPRDHFDDDTAAEIEAGHFDWFQVRVRVLLDHRFEIGVDYLGGCCYRNATDFVDSEHRDGYFRDMVRAAIADARAHLRKYPVLRAA